MAIINTVRYRAGGAVTADSSDIPEVVILIEDDVIPPRQCSVDVAGIAPGYDVPPKRGRKYRLEDCRLRSSRFDRSARYKRLRELDALRRLACRLALTRRRPPPSPREWTGVRGR